MISVLTELIAIPSVGGTEAEIAIQYWLADRLAGLGLGVDLWPIDLAAVRGRPDYPGEEVDRTAAYGLIATNAPGERPALILCGHVDVVPVGDPASWTSEPFAPVVDDGRVIGRGACDMKGGVAAIMAAIEQVLSEAADVPPFAVHFVVGEEDGGLGAYATLARGHGGAACIIPEPTDLQMITANAGALTFRIEVPGRATHGSTRYEGYSAIDGYLPIHAALAELERSRNLNPEPLLAEYPIAYPLSVGRITGGDWPSSVPDLVIVEGRYGLRVDEQPAAGRAELEAAVAQAASRDRFLRDHPPRVSWPGGIFRGGRLVAGHPLRDLVAVAHADVTGRPVGQERGGPYGSDLRHYVGAGIPTLHYGPGSPREAHGPDEAVSIEEVMITAQVLALALRRSATLPPPAAG